MLMRDYPTLRIRIEGHICCVVAKNADGYDYDSQDFNLSVNRAKEIYDILEEKGIDDTRMEYKGFGKTRPLAWPEQTEEDENKNRRVEIRILQK
jgi:outer membrane protein OmpA-like peptidoglycan-associated protein